MKASILNRKLHRWGAILIALPLLVVICSGILLQFKKQAAWIQPPTARGAGGDPTISFEQVLEAARGAGKGIESWEDVDRLDFRPDKGVVKVRGRNRWEVQVDTATGAVVQTAYRRSDLIETIHDGSWFSDGMKLYLFLPSAVVLLALWFTGIYLWWLPHGVRRRKRRAAASGEAQ
ncbi:MAG: PepSY domain-containing protein [Planctomycetes bacterium]|nr:PepSY domain-containing protein [Planctomycetota bacterium]MBL7009325.1 PepSY domain-containing protein [Planctomycetota bacterium]